MSTEIRQMFKNKKQLISFIIIVLIMLAFPDFAAAQCAMCKASVESSQGQANSVAGGINKGILYLMAIPYLLLMFIFRKQLVALWKNIRGKETSETIDLD